MTEEGNLRIGATVDTGALQEGFASAESLADHAAQQLAVSFEECSTRTKAAFAKLSEDVKAAAESMSAESLKVAEATKAQAAAFADLRRARIIANDVNVDSAASLSVLAAAQHKAVTASEELAAAQKAEAASTAEGAEEVALSSNAIVAAFQRAEMAVFESLAGMKERMYLTTEGVKLNARDMMGAFTSFGELLGAGLLADMGVHAADSVVKYEVELGHLSDITKISATDLAGLEEIVKGMGLEWDRLRR